MKLLLLVYVQINQMDSALDYINGDRNVEGDIWLGELFPIPFFLS